MTRPFRFMGPVPEPQPKGRWQDALRRMEDLGFSSARVVDHFTETSALEPITAMTAAVAVTRRLRVVSLVACNDYRHPVMTHRMAAFIDVLSEGRLELGLGAGWMRSDYDAAGIGYDTAAVRIARLGEAVSVIKRLFGDAPVDHHGEHYRISGLNGLPKPVQRPHPPLLIGGGGRRILSLAAREADIVGINANMRAGAVTSEAAADLGPDSIAEKVLWVREAALAAGRQPDSYELQISCFVTNVTKTTEAARQALEGVAGYFGMSGADEVATSPGVLVGTVEQCVETLQERRERYGFSYFDLRADPETTAPIVARLSGT
ncbi:MAG: TIGR03621 family F420-dependent LLM class oxidoreductase [Chloroflexi bacterium]|nr:MAG: TIGR03621 family F420-dependent LLM class oxidoreductase [Chloroflexota bacterium]